MRPLSRDLIAVLEALVVTAGEEATAVVVLTADPSLGETLDQQGLVAKVEECRSWFKVDRGHMRDLRLGMVVLTMILMLSGAGAAVRYD